jgi:hypothetical protein
MFYQLLTWFWPVNEMTELVSGMPAPQFWDESSLSAMMRAGSSFKCFLCFVLIYVSCFRVPQLEDHWCKTLKVNQPTFKSTHTIAA